MISLTVSKNSLRNALDIAQLATESSELIHSHAIFKINGDSLKVYSTNKNRISMATCDIKECTKDESDPLEFTLNPKKISAVIKNSDVDDIKFKYNPEEKNLDVYSSENKESKLSFPSFDPSEFLPVWENIEVSQEMKKVNAGIFMIGIKFSYGYITDNKKNRRFRLIYIEDDSIYGTDGLTRVGMFKSPALSGLDVFMISPEMVSAIAFLINKTNIANAVIKTTSKHVFITSEDESFCFGFLKSNEKMIKFPISSVIPDEDGFSVDKASILKKFGRLSIAAGKDAGIKITLENNEIDLSTLSEHASNEKMPCSRFKSGEKKEFYMDQGLFKRALDKFPSANVSVYILSNKLMIRDEGKLSIDNGTNTPDIIPFSAVGIVGRGRG